MHLNINQNVLNRIGKVLATSALDREFEPRSEQTKDYKIGMCCFSAKHADWLARNRDNVSEWGDMSIRGLLFQKAGTMKIQTKRVDLVHSGPHHHRIVN